MARILLGVTGSVAAVRTPALARAFDEAGHNVRVLATEPALHFFNIAELPPPGPDHESEALPPARSVATPTSGPHRDTGEGTPSCTSS